jgi:hypothetical protein
VCRKHDSRTLRRSIDPDLPRFARKICKSLAGMGAQRWVIRAP